MRIRPLYPRLRINKCGKGDLNSRTPTRMDSKSIAFDQTWQFPHDYFSDLINILKGLKINKSITLFKGG